MFSSLTRNIFKSNNFKIISPLFSQQKRNICKTLFIKGIVDTITAEQIEAQLKEYGPIQVVRIITLDAKFKSVYALVSFENMVSALSVMDELQSTIMFGRRISIEYSKFSYKHYRKGVNENSNSNNSNNITSREQNRKENLIHVNDK